MTDVFFSSAAARAVAPASPMLSSAAVQHTPSPGQHFKGATHTPAAIAHARGPTPAGRERSPKCVIAQKALSLSRAAEHSRARLRLTHVAPSRIALRAASIFILSIFATSLDLPFVPSLAPCQAPQKSHKSEEVYDRPPLYSVHRKEQINRIGVEPSLFGIKYEKRNSKSLSPQEADGDTHQALVNHRQTTAHSRPSDLILIHFARRPRGDESRGGWMRCGPVRRPNMIQKHGAGRIPRPSSSDKSRPRETLKIWGDEMR